MSAAEECQTNRVEVTETNTIEIVLNGEPRRVPAGMTIDRLLAWLEMDASRVAIELNREIVRKPDWPNARVETGAHVEVVWFVGGG